MGQRPIGVDGNGSGTPAPGSQPTQKERRRPRKNQGAGGKGKKSQESTRLRILQELEESKFREIEEAAVSLNPDVTPTPTTPFTPRKEDTLIKIGCLARHRTNFRQMKIQPASRDIS